MSAADTIAEARALIEPLTGHTEAPWWTDGEYSEDERGIAVIAARTDTGPLPGNPTRGMVAWASQLLPENAGICEADARLIAAAPALRDTVAALADLADAQAQEIARLKGELARYAIHEEYDCPGDTPEFCGWLCSICGEHVEENGSGHLNDCVIRDHNQHGTSTRSPEVAQ